jgi:hypothetical protein
LPGPGAGGSIWAAAARGHVLAHGDGDLDAAHRLVVGTLEAVGPEVEPAALVAALDTLLMICRFADRAELWSPLRALAARHADCIPAELALSVRSAGRLRPVPPDRLDAAPRPRCPASAEPRGGSWVSRSTPRAPAAARRSR